MCYICSADKVRFSRITRHNATICTELCRSYPPHFFPCRPYLFLCGSYRGICVRNTAHTFWIGKTMSARAVHMGNMSDILLQPCINSSFWLPKMYGENQNEWNSRAKMIEAVQNVETYQNEQTDQNEQSSQNVETYQNERKTCERRQEEIRAKK